MNFAQSILDSLEEEVVVIDSSGNILLVNLSWEKFAFENDGGELCAQPIGINYLDICRKSYESSKDKNIKFVLTSLVKLCSGEINSFQSEYTCHSPSKKRWFLMRASKVQNKNQIVISHSNITDRVVAEEKTKLLNVQLEKKVLEKTEKIKSINISLQRRMAEIIRKDSTLVEKDQRVEQALLQEKELNDLKTKFITIISHEIRTPLTNINLSAEMLLKYQASLDEAAKKKYLQDIPNSCKRITQILDQFFFINKVDTKNKMSNLSVLNFKDLWEEILRDLNYINSQTTNRIHIQGMESIKVPMQIDTFLVKHIMSNLLSNALKYSDSDVSLIIEQYKEEIIFIVKDSGIGILEEDKANIFNPFFRGNNSSHRPGIGLGLYIVKRALDLCKGNLEYTSQEKIGTEFRVSIPILFEKKEQ